MFGGRDLLQLSDEELRGVRGREIAMIFQDPMTSLNPVLTIGRQIREALETHFGMDKREADGARRRAARPVGIPSAQARLRDYPHQFSGGMRQRAMIAMALACEPKLLIADEPTTALDVTIQAQILDLLRELVAERDTALILITHDLGVVAGMCERVNVMYAGHVRGDRHRRAALRAARGIRTRSACCRACRGSTPARKTALQPIEGARATCCSPPQRVPVRAALPLRGRAVARRRCRRSSEIEPGPQASPASTRCPTDEWQRMREAARRA